jgi:hypothetical protein
MPALRISLDGVTIATIATNGLDLLDIRVSGMRFSEDFADLRVSGGSFDTGGASRYLTWITSMPIHAGQTIGVSLHEYGESSLPGKTFSELFPDESPADHSDFVFTKEMFNDLRAMPMLRERYLFSVTAPSGASYVGETTPDDYSFAFSVLWHASNPEVARTSLRSSTVENLEARKLCRLFNGEIAYGDVIELHIE